MITGDIKIAWFKVWFGKSRYIWIQEKILLFLNKIRDEKCS
jgi:hypothetical protein